MIQKVLLKKIIPILFCASLVITTGCEDVCEFESITPDSLPQTQTGVFYSQFLSVNTECFELLTDFRFVGGQLPPGISFDYFSGAITGTPTRRGTYKFTVRATVCFSRDIYGYFDCRDRSKGYTIVVE